MSSLWQYVIKPFLIISGIVITIISVNNCAKNCPSENCIHKDFDDFNDTCNGYDCYCTGALFQHDCIKDWRVKAVCELKSIGKGLGLSIFIYVLWLIFSIYLKYLIPGCPDERSDEHLQLPT